MNTLKNLAIALVILGGVPLQGLAATPTTYTAAPDREGWFGGVGLGTLTLEDSEGFADALFYAYLVGGWRPSRYLSIEARAGTSFSSVLEFEDAELGEFFPEVEFRAPSILGVYARAIWPVLDRVDLYAQAGYTHARIKASLVDGTETISAQDSQGSLSYGLGVSWLLGQSFALDLEFQPELVDGDVWKMQSLNASFRMRF
jgi:opacity protein-like surface antigen